MYCNRCGAELVEGAKFCNFCGTPVPNKKNQPQDAPNLDMNNQPQGAPNPYMNYGPVAPNPNAGKKTRMSKTEKIIAIILVVVISVALITTTVVAVAFPMSKSEVISTLNDANNDDS